MSDFATFVSIVGGWFVWFAIGRMCGEASARRDQERREAEAKMEGCDVGAEETDRRWMERLRDQSGRRN